MAEYKVKIIETLTKTLTVNAENADDAEDMVRDMYKKSEVVLTSDDFYDTDYLVTGTSNKLSGDCCSCGGTEFLSERISESTVLVTFADGKPKYRQESEQTLNTEHRSFYTCKACGKEYERA